MKRLLIYSITLVSLYSCTGSSVQPSNQDPDSNIPTNENTSIKGKIEYTGRISLSEGPTDLHILGSQLYAVRDGDIYVYSLSNPAIPSFQKKYNSTGKFGKITHQDNKLHVPSLTENVIYEFDKNLNVLKKISLPISNFKPEVCFLNSEGQLWVGGSNGTNGVLAYFSKTGGNYSLENQWTSPSSQSNIESIIQNSNHIIASLASGNVLSFQQNKINLGPVDNFSYDSEPEHEKWGHTLIKVGQQAFWANWGAGLANINVANPSNLTMKSVISHTSMKAQFPDSEGTNVYDVDYNSTHKMICVANGWSGLLLVNPDNPERVYDYLDLQYVQNRSVATKDNYVYTGNISGGMSGDLKGIMIYKLKL